LILLKRTVRELNIAGFAAVKWLFALHPTDKEKLIDEHDFITAEQVLKHNFMNSVPGIQREHGPGTRFLTRRSFTR